MLHGVDKVFVLHVKSFKDREAHIRQMMSDFAIEFEFILEHDVPELTDDVVSRYFSQNDLRAPVKSCCLKHIAALEKIAEGNYHRAIVFEDDIFLAPDFNEQMDKVIKESALINEPHVCYLGNASNMYTPKKQLKEGQKLYQNKEGRAADSYMLGAQEARLRLDWISKHKVNLPADHLFNKIDAELGIKFMWVEDPIVEQGTHSGKFVTSLDHQVRHPLHQKIKFAWQKLRKKYIYRLFQ